MLEMLSKIQLIQSGEEKSSNFFHTNIEKLNLLTGLSEVTNYIILT